MKSITGFYTLIIKITGEFVVKRWHLDMMIHSTEKHPLQRKVALVSLFMVFFASYLLLKSGSPDLIQLVGFLWQVGLDVTGCLLAFPFFLPGIPHTRWHGASLLQMMAFPHTSQQWVPLLLFLSILCHATGQLIAVTLYRLAPPFPSWVDAYCLTALLPLLVAILLLPSRPLPAEKRLQIVLDSVIIMVGAVTFSWYFFLGPLILQTQTIPIMTRIVSSAYPVGALVLVFCLLLLLHRTNDRARRPIIFLLSLALAILALTYGLAGYLPLHPLSLLQALLPVVGALGCLLMGLAARNMQISMHSTDLPTSTTPSASVSFTQKTAQDFSPPLLWRSLLPYLLAPPVILLLVWTAYLGGNRALEPGVSLGAITLVGLIVIRQVFTVRAMIAQNNILCLMQQHMHETNKALRLVKGQLEQQAKQLGQANEQLSQLNLLRDQFIANANHELRTPLTQVDGYLELLSEYQGRLREATQTTFIKRAKEGSQELLLLVNNFLNVLRANTEIEPPHMEQVALWQVVHDVCEQFPPERELGSRLQMELPDSLVVKADQCYLRQIIRNLLSNALKYSPPKASVTIGARLVDRTGPSRVLIYVHDEGPGIFPEDQALLFQKFVRLKRDLAGSISGTGLGLYMCKQLVEAMNGEIWIESSGKMGEGSTFCFTLMSKQ